MPYAKTQWRQTTARLSPSLVIPDAPTNPNDVPTELTVAPALPPFRMTCTQYQAILDN